MIKEYINYLKDNPQHYWFKAKPYGWGWTPATWQGWVTIIIFVILLIANAYRLEAFSDEVPHFIERFILQTIILTGILLGVCYLTGEPPRWQWGIPKSNKKNK